MALEVARCRSGVLSAFYARALALGLVGFAAYCFVTAALRIVPRAVPPDLHTLATHAPDLLTRSSFC
ncbi:hypothetical protein [Steroidobacter sp.]|uniref:hypothetical protein n=1 Tax=Steroidobacter sp. TaxID=1978227 RepID=UPI001A56DB59|nr:hypothetical protein [Steroidobacter sp.]MBL8271498.1 hypothetical protein [Steroidobacter sp.]